MHNLETAADGRAAFFSARETPWHRLGTVTTECLTAEEAMRAAHLDWTVEKYPLTTTVPVIGENGVTDTMIPVPDKFAMVRTNPFTGQPEVLSVMGNAYTPIQNLDNAEVLDAIVGESGAHFETAGALDSGRQVFVSMKAPEGLMIGGQDAVDLYLVATNSHNGSSAFKIVATPVRVVCANTLALGLQTAKASFSIRHTSGAKDRIEEARKALGVMWNYSKVFEQEANRMLATKVTDKQFDQIVAGLFPEKENESERSANTRQKAVNNVRFLHREAPTQDGIRGTAWGAYNAIVEYVDWAWPVKGDQNARAERVALGGWTTQVKQNAYEALVRL